MNYAITIETDLFEHREVKSHFINPCCFGEDFAAWLRRELQPLMQDGFSFSEPVQEDYGWGFWAKRGEESFWLALSYAGEGPQEEPAQWVVSFDGGRSPIKRLFRKSDATAFTLLRELIWDVIRFNPSMKVIEG
jgi:hypothetical protein